LETNHSFFTKTDSENLSIAHVILINSTNQFSHQKGDHRMKTLAIHGSPRTTRSTTRRLAGLVLEGAADAGSETEMIDLTDYLITPCAACDCCSFTGSCVFDDDVPALVNRMREADAIIFGSPVYIDNISGQMKVFFDRLADVIHYQVLAGKFGCAVATTYESGGDNVVAYLNHVLNYLGLITVGGISVATAGRVQAVEEAGPAARALGRKLARAVTNGFCDPAQEAIIADNRSYFQTIVGENRDFRPEEYDRWVRMGWIE
jgi:multimeric flavodoxin WrbA